MSKVFPSTEFVDDGSFIQPLILALVRETGHPDEARHNRLIAQAIGLTPVKENCDRDHRSRR